MLYDSGGLALALIWDRVRPSCTADSAAGGRVGRAGKLVIYDTCDELRARVPLCIDSLLPVLQPAAANERRETSAELSKLFRDKVPNRVRNRELRLFLWK